VVAFGTSAPELVVNVFASITKHSDITLGNIIGSNIFNLLLILGIAAIVSPLFIQRQTVRVEIPFSLMATLFLMLVVNDVMIFHKYHDVLSRFEGILFLLFFIIFFVYVFFILKTPSAGLDDIKIYPFWKTSLLLFLGLAGLFIGGRLIVDNGIIIAHKLHISEKLIALTFISMGTSLPELATSVVAAVKKRYDISVGNILGSNIFNIFFILGISALINPISYDIVLNTDLIVLMLANIILFAAMFTGKKYIVDRWEGIVFLSLFIGYMVYLVIRK
ncbi:MAG: calcium/sodium antiporter, partial [bacterium]|nr:calcium/sodium antiporter [bacterium]